MADPEKADHRLDGQLQTLAEEAILAMPRVDAVLTDAARAAAAGTGLSCGITYVARYGAVTVASSDALANAVDELQYGAGDGPCLEAMRSATVVRVDDLGTEHRWGGYPQLALAAGVRSSLSYPLMVDDRSVGALNVYSGAAGPWPADREAAVIVASSQAAGALQAVRRFASRVAHDRSAASALQERHEVGIATGMVMSQRGCTDSEAREILAERASAEGIPVRMLVSRMIAEHDGDAGTTQ